MGTAKTSNKDGKEKLHEIIEEARTVVLLTHGEGHRIVGRPMSLVRINDEDEIYLVANIASKKVSEILQDSRVTISAQSGKGVAMIDGEAAISGNPKLVDELWTDSWKVWFPKGKTDPDIAILVVRPLEGTYWEMDLGHGLSFAYRYVKARLTGSEIEAKQGDQQKVDLHKH
jgi:general stress protein 26